MSPLQATTHEAWCPVSVKVEGTVLSPEAITRRGQTHSAEGDSSFIPPPLLQVRWSYAGMHQCNRAQQPTPSCYKLMWRAV